MIIGIVKSVALITVLTACLSNTVRNAAGAVLQLVNVLAAAVIILYMLTFYNVFIACGSALVSTYGLVGK